MDLIAAVKRVDLMTRNLQDFGPVTKRARIYVTT